MCGRYYIDNEEENIKVRAIMRELNRRRLPRYDQVQIGEIFPSQVAPVILLEQDIGPTVRPMQWGFPRGGGGGLVINSRSEKADVTPMFQKAAREKRCLIPASHFFEWKREDGKKTKSKFAFRPDTDEPLMYMAGFYGTFLGGFEQDGFDGFTILTRAANGQMSPYHDRMPVILTDEALKKAWLNHEIPYPDLRKAFDPPVLRIWEQNPDTKQSA